jgi:hypothetical protein
MGIQAPVGVAVVLIRALRASVVSAGVSPVQVMAFQEVPAAVESNTRETKVPVAG